MFAKPYNLRATNTLKSSQKKSIVHRLMSEYPQLTSDQAQELVPTKSCVVWLKVHLASGQEANILAVDHWPILLKLRDDTLVPTVCALWKAPNMLPTITIHEHILKKVATGMPLYVPGIQTVGLPQFQAGWLVAACTNSNSSAALVARALCSSADILRRTSGACLEILHVYGDHLCKDRKFEHFERPLVTPKPHNTNSVATKGTATNEHSDNDSVQDSTGTSWDQFPGLGHTSSASQAHSPFSHEERSHSPITNRAHEERYHSPITNRAHEERYHSPITNRAHEERSRSPIRNRAARVTDNIHTCSAEKIADTFAASVKIDENPPKAEDPPKAESPPIGDGPKDLPTDMDQLLKWALLAFIKFEAKKVELPLKTNLLYKNYLIPLCQPHRQLDVKKSSYKKLSKFLEVMQQEGLLELHEEEKGVWTIRSVNTSHPLVRPVTAPSSLLSRQAPAPAPPGQYAPPRIHELHCVTASITPLFPDHRKGSALSVNEIRQATREYARTRQLASQGARAVTLDPTLANILGLPVKETVGWEALMAGVVGRMTPAVELRFPNGDITLLKHKLPLITMSVVSRAGNKKVTLVSNLEVYGFDLVSLARSWQSQVGAACVVTRTPSAQHDQLLLQGDQTYFVAKTLTQQYGLAKKYVEGADKALSKKKR